MASIENDLRLFGLDLRHLRRDLGAAGSALQHSWLLSWLTPTPVVRLFQADGTTRYWRLGDKPASLPAGPSAARFNAVELPQDLFLHRELSLPKGLDSTQVRAAVELDLQSASPFASHDLLWGHVVQMGANGTQKASAAMASRQQVQTYLLGLAPKLMAQWTAARGASTPAAPGDAVEVWALPPELRQPVVLHGHGEKVRERYIAARRRWGYALLALVLGLLVAIAVTPTAQWRLRAVDALRQHANVVQRTSPDVQKRETLLQSAEKLKSLSDELALRIDPLRVLETLTAVLPDDTFLHVFKLQGNKVTLAGQTANASALMQLLGNQPGFRDVRAPSAANRAPGSSKDSYVIELVLDPGSFAVATVKPAPPPSTDEAASAAAAAGVGAAAASSSAPPPVGVVVPTPEPSFGGGGPSFGGAPTRAALPAAPRATGGIKP
jgi:general secretion pathway protein L